jgi:microcin C transport system permease protein
MPSPLARRQWQRFRSIGRGYWSAVALLVLVGLGAGAELLASHRAIVVVHEGRWYLPTYGEFLPGTTFGFDYDYETNYRDLAARFAAEDAAAHAAGRAPSGNWLLLPPVPYSPLESDFVDGSYPPYPPSARHWLGTDTSGRDVVARLLYGFRIAIAFSLLLLLANYAVGVAIGCAMGYFGGAFDLLFQRLIEIWSNVPFLYVIMIIASIIVPTFWTLALVMVLFGWTGMTWYMRTATYRERAREYVTAARALGASPARTIFRHILPNTLSTIVTFVPFSVASGITSLTALDYLGFGLPPPTPSWGELLAQGTDNLQRPWIVTSVVVALCAVLMMVTFIGEAVREAFDPRRFSYYE